MQAGKKRKLRRIIAGAATLVLLIAAILYGATMLERAQQSEREKALQAQGKELRASPWTAENTVSIGGKQYGIDHRVESFLFIGTDHSGNSDPADFRGAMADFLLLMVMDHTENTIGYLQIDRNTVTSVRELDPEGNEITSRDLQICTAHWYGRNPEMAAENTVYAVQNLLGGLKHIDGYFIMDMSEIGQLNHSVGGVEVMIQDDMDASDSSLVRGETIHLDDVQAEHFLRARMNVGEGTNAERMARQRQYMASFFRRVKEETAENPRFGIELWNTLKDIAETNMNGNDFSRIAQKLLKGEDKGIHTIRGETVVGSILQDGKKHEEFYPETTSIREEMTNLFSMEPIRDGDENRNENGDGV